MLITPDGWRVEVLVVDGVPQFRVTYRGRTPLLRTRGLVLTHEHVAAIMGPAFANLVEES